MIPGNSTVLKVNRLKVAAKLLVNKLNRLLNKKCRFTNSQIGNGSKNGSDHYLSSEAS